jgi:hypothetical protein
MKMFYIRAKISARVFGISGPFEKVVSYLVSAPDPTQAQKIYETQVKQDFAHMHPESLNYEYQEVAPQI